MRLLRFLRQRIHQPEGDVASDDWAPVPVSATAAPESWGEWLSEEVEEAPPPTPTNEPIARKNFGPIIEAKPVRKKRPSTYEQHLTPEERAIIESQKQRSTVKPEKKRSRRPNTEELIREFGSHLTEEERRIIEEQQQT